MKKFLLSFAVLILSTSAVAQTSAKTDSIFKSLNLKFSTEALNQAKEDYESANDTVKMIMLKVYSMPMSSKKELIGNYENKRSDIHELKATFEKMIPKGYIVSLELKESERVNGLVEAIDFQVFKKDASGELDMIEGDWDLKYGSDELDKLLKVINWDRMTLLAIKNLLQTANCISIQNGEHAEIGFSRSGLGKYYYILFPKKLNKDLIKKYNDRCEHIFYKDNVVLKYVGGMVGPQCFTD